MSISSATRFNTPGSIPGEFSSYIRSCKITRTEMVHGHNLGALIDYIQKTLTRNHADNESRRSPDYESMERFSREPSGWAQARSLAVRRSREFTCLAVPQQLAEASELAFGSNSVAATPEEYYNAKRTYYNFSSELFIPFKDCNEAEEPGEVEHPAPLAIKNPPPTTFDKMEDVQPRYMSWNPELFTLNANGIENESSQDLELSDEEEAKLENATAMAEVPSNELNMILMSGYRAQRRRDTPPALRVGRRHKPVDQHTAEEALRDLNSIGGYEEPELVPAPLRVTLREDRPRLPHQLQDEKLEAKKPQADYLQKQQPQENETQADEPQQDGHQAPENNTEVSPINPISPTPPRLAPIRRLSPLIIPNRNAVPPPATHSPPLHRPLPRRPRSDFLPAHIHHPASPPATPSSAGVLRHKHERHTLRADPRPSTYHAGMSAASLLSRPVPPTPYAMARDLGISDPHERVSPRGSAIPRRPLGMDAFRPAASWLSGSWGPDDVGSDVVGGRLSSAWSPDEVGRDGAAAPRQSVAGSLEAEVDGRRRSICEVAVLEPEPEPSSAMEDEEEGSWVTMRPQEFRPLSFEEMGVWVPKKKTPMQKFAYRASKILWRK
ncbi:hypothetical protein SLS57_010391 [Botryosphaeria dothidea]